MAQGQALVLAGTPPKEMAADSPISAGSDHSAGSGDAPDNHGGIVPTIIFRRNIRISGVTLWRRDRPLCLSGKRFGWKRSPFGMPRRGPYLLKLRRNDPRARVSP